MIIGKKQGFKIKIPKFSDIRKQKLDQKCNTDKVNIDRYEYIF